MISEKLEIVGPEAIRDPHGYFGRLRDRAPIVWDTKSRSWVVTSYNSVVEILRDETRFSSDRIRPFIDKKLSGPDVDPKVLAAFRVLENWLVFNDRPKHRRLRMLINQAFMSRAMTRLTERFADLCDEIIDAAPQEGVFDLLEQVTIPYSASVISEMLGVPREDRDMFEGWHRLFGPIVGASLEDPNKYDSLARGVDELSTYVRTLIDRYRTDPQDNLLSELIKARDSNDALTEEEIIATCTLVLFAGSETTANLMGNGVSALVQYPEQMAMLRDGKVEFPQAIEEILRFDGSGKAVTRVLAEDTEFDGVEMKKGQRVFLILAAANHDPDIYSSADKLVLDRNFERGHLAFGSGIHSCMGLQLARLEVGIALPKILDKWGKIELVDELEWHPQLLSRTLKSLRVRVAP